MPEFELTRFISGLTGWGVVTFLLVLVLVGKMRLERELLTLEQDRDEWKQRAERMSALTDRAMTVGVADTLVRREDVAETIAQLHADIETLKRQQARARRERKGGGGGTGGVT